MPTLNLGIVAHVDAGKTTLTERLLLETGVITSAGRVDHGDTTTDSDDVERRRGITIRSAVVTFALGDVKVNLIDTPGHSDFVAEVERALAVLDGAVLVVSAVEGVQAQTRVLIRLLERLQIPFLVFANKIDRGGATYERTMADLRDALAGEAVAVTVPINPGDRTAGVTVADDPESHDQLVGRLAELDDQLLRRYVDDAAPPTRGETMAALTRLTAGGGLHPVYFGSALDGTGVAHLADGIRRHLPASTASAEQPLQASIFKIENDAAGRKLAYARLRAGTLTVRDRIVYHRRLPTGLVVERAGRVTGVEVFAHGAATVAATARAGDIAKVVGLSGVEIGDQLGWWDAARGGRHFPPPGLEAVVVARDPVQRPELFHAMLQLAEQDPLINARVDGIDQELTVSLYGEVQKEVIAERLATHFGVIADFSPTRTVHIERVSGTGEAFEQVPSGNASVGLRVEPGPVGSGVDYRIAVERGWLQPSFHTAIEETLAAELESGPYGWRVTDCVVTLTQSRYSAPTPPAGYFRSLTAGVLRAALEIAGTTVCAPASEFEVELPTGSLQPVLHDLHAARAAVQPPMAEQSRCRVRGVIATERIRGLEQRLPGLTHGEGILFSHPAGYQPVAGRPPTRRQAVESQDVRSTGTPAGPAA